MSEHPIVLGGARGSAHGLTANKWARRAGENESRERAAQLSVVVNNGTVAGRDYERRDP